MSRTSGTLVLKLVATASNLLHFLIFVKIFLLVTSISFISVALLSHERRLQGRFGERGFLLASGLYVGLASAGSGLANALALLGLRLWRRALLLPYIACILFGGLYCLCYLFEMVFLLGIQELGLLAAIAGLLTSAAVLFHLVPTFLAMKGPRPRPAGREGEAPPASPPADHPPGYDTLMETTLPGYDDSMVEKPETAADKLETDADKPEAAPEVK